MESRIEFLVLLFVVCCLNHGSSVKEPSYMNPHYFPVKPGDKCLLFVYTDIASKSRNRFTKALTNFHTEITDIMKKSPNRPYHNKKVSLAPGYSAMKLDIDVTADYRGITTHKWEVTMSLSTPRSRQVYQGHLTTVTTCSLQTLMECFNDGVYQMLHKLQPLVKP